MLLRACLLVVVALVAGAAPASATAGLMRALPGVVVLIDGADGLRIERIGAGEPLPALYSSDSVLIVEPDVRLELASVDPEPLRSGQWALDALEIESVWTRSDGAGAVVAVIDSGVDANHPDLADRLVPGQSFVAGPETEDDHGHGTHVAGIIAATTGNGYGIAGVAPGARVMPLRVIGADGSGFASDAADAVLWAIHHGADVINISLAGRERSTVLDATISEAVAQGVVVVVAAGNEAEFDNPPMYPSSHPDVLAVGATEHDGDAAFYSSYGDWVDIAAPGSRVLSLHPGEGFREASGTSMAAPHVAGAAALLRAAAPDLSGAEIVAALLATAADAGDAGRDDSYGHGALDVVAALDHVVPAAAAVQAPPPRCARDTWGEPAPGTSRWCWR